MVEGSHSGGITAGDRVCAEARAYLSNRRHSFPLLVQIIELVILEVACSYGFKIWMDL